MQVRRLFTYWVAVSTIATLVFRHFGIPVQIQEAIAGLLLVAFLAGARAQHWVEAKNDYL